MSRREATRWPVWPLIRAARRRAGLDPSELAALAGISPVAMARYERALVLPDLATLHRIVEACGCRLRIEVVEAALDEFPALEWSVEDRLRANESSVDAVEGVRRG